MVFLPGETDDRQWWVIWCRAVVEDQPLTCGISYHALCEHFGADLADPLSAFRAHRPAIEQLMAQFLAQQGHVHAADPPVIRSYDVRALRP